jgi:predicted ATPase/DNA-binding CsgD family transcriptional regulator
LEIRRLLAVAHTVTLTGQGGIGKSRLALHAAHKLGRHFSDGVWWVELAELESSEVVVEALAHSLEVVERPDVPLEAALLAHLRERRLLLVLDNCEGLLEACRPLASSIVSRCEDVRILCTSRQRLGVPGETIVVLSPLELPATAYGLSVEALAGVEALQLLVDRARATSDFVLTDENCAAASDICRRLDGLPLAIELAAVRLASITAGDLLERLDDRFRLLTGERGQQSRRHQALRATVEWSHELLGEEERILWRRLSVFAGSVGIEAAEAVCSGGGLERERVLDLIGSLVDRSILTMTQGRRGRYRLLETMRLYGAERLREAGEETELERRHAAWYLELVSGTDRPWWASGVEADFVEVLDVEWANVEAALEFCAGSAPDAEMGLRIATDMWAYWMLRGRYRSGSRHLEAFLAIAPAPGPYRAMGLWALGWLEQATGDHDAALARFEEVRRISTGPGRERELAYALLGAGLVGLRRGEGTAAFELVVESRMTMERAGDPIGVALILYYLATALTVAGRPTEALAIGREGLDRGPPADSMLRALLGTLLGIVEWLLGDAEAADASLKAAVRVQARLDHRWGLATSLDGLAWTAASSGRLERASLLLGAVSSLWQELGIVPVPYWQGHHDDSEATVLSGLDEDRYRASFEQGAALGRGEVVGLALEDELPPPGALAHETADESFQLTARELEVARLVADGLSNPAIAATLFLSRATVKTHVSHILRKLTLDSRVQLASWVAAHDPELTALSSR